MHSEITEALSAWYVDNGIDSFADRAYLFGSLINEDGDSFWPTGVRTSDIDFLIRINPERATAVPRTEALKEVKDLLPPIEAKIEQILERDPEHKDSVLSVLPVTWYELYNCIHKGFDPKIFTLNIFFDIVNMVDRKGGLSDYIDKSYHFDNTETFAVMRLSQSLRNAYLRRDDEGCEVLKPFKGVMAIPKELMRAAALLKYVETEGKKPKTRTSLREGEDYFTKLVERKSGDHDDIARLYEKIVKRGSTTIPPHNKPALEPIDLILASELLFDEAKELSLPSVRETIDRMRRMSEDKPVYS
ncbi:hypothetical protein [Yoonia sp. 208BN28-4]|uniref:hypothetical protein n=1 Tax=Yoonia sp. 208BN28-4 TaxID=3126505 RepID=UPI0030962FAC